MADAKARVLIVGTGGVGTMAAYALETGGKAEVTAVMRSNYDAVEKNGIAIDSIEHGHDIKGWRPTAITRKVPNVSEEKLQPFDFVVVTTKNVPEVPPTVAEIIAPAVTPGRTAIVLSQNGLNIEKPLLAAFPANPVVSSISYIGATERAHGVVLHDCADAQRIGAFPHPALPAAAGDAAARRYVALYNAAGRLDVVHDAEVAAARWRKLLYNASYNGVAAVVRMDTARMRMSRHVVDELIRPLMREVAAAAAAAAGVALPDAAADAAIRVDPTHTAFRPSMCQDADKGNFLEIETIVGEPLREGEARGVAMPTLRTLYGLLRAVQLQIFEKKGLWEPKFAPDNPYQ
ncbi:putative 2-dehydropantoate 2-reductase [Xylariomycetidae sp. FL0641]|nr:putative 2-dehydropantoate 2-reductase [Xylariomycetidae sp. FL0641]